MSIRPGGNLATAEGGSTKMELLSHVRLTFWLFATGAIALYAFFVVVAAVPPAKIAGVTAAVALLSALLTIRQIRLRGELADPGGDPRIRRAHNRLREHRGF